MELYYSMLVEFGCNPHETCDRAQRSPVGAGGGAPVRGVCDDVTQPSTRNLPESSHILFM